LNDQTKYLLSQSLLNNPIEDSFTDHIKLIVYRIMSLFFHLKSYSNATIDSDNHLANIVKSSCDL